jgi:hypothetical protein
MGHRRGNVFDHDNRYRRARRRLSGIALAALLAALLPAAVVAARSRPVKGGTYRGKATLKGATRTIEGPAVTFKVSRNGKKILNFTSTLGYDGKCGQGGGPAYAVRAQSIPLARNGGFKGHATGTLGTLHPVTIDVSGRIQGRTAHGTIVEPKALCVGAPNAGAKAYLEQFTAKAK